MSVGYYIDLMLELWKNMFTCILLMKITVADLGAPGVGGGVSNARPSIFDKRKVLM